MCEHDNAVFRIPIVISKEYTNERYGIIETDILTISNAGPPKQIYTHTKEEKIPIVLYCLLHNFRLYLVL